jgi:hypothetical protein
MKFGKADKESNDKLQTHFGMKLATVRKYVKDLFPSNISNFLER